MVNRVKTRRKPRMRRDSSEKMKEEDETEDLLNSTSPLSSRTPENTENIFLDDMIRHSKDNLFRISIKQKEDYLQSSTHQKRRKNALFYNKPIEFLKKLVAHFSLMIRIHPKASIMLITGTIILAFASFSQLARPQINDPLIYTDYSDIQSVYDLALGKIDHWCLAGDDDSCKCEDPLQPVSRLQYKQWVNAQRDNNDSVRKIVTKFENLDVVFLGESIVEEWKGRKMGKEYSQFNATKLSFQNHFNQTTGGNFSGLPLGINGDTSPNVLWRLLHGEMDENFNPKVWWVVIGTNELAIHECSEEVVLLGILRVIEEIMLKKPSATIIINSLLPMTMDEDGRYNDFQLDQNFTEYNQEVDDIELERSTNGNGLRNHDNNRNVAWLKISKKKQMLWSSVTAINEQLREFCKKNSEKVHFFDVDEIFLETNKDGVFLRNELLSNHGHPTPMGHLLWHKEITKMVHKVLQK